MPAGEATGMTTVTGFGVIYLNARVQKTNIQMTKRVYPPYTWTVSPMDTPRYSNVTKTRKSLKMLIRNTPAKPIMNSKIALESFGFLISTSAIDDNTPKARTPWIPVQSLSTSSTRGELEFAFSVTRCPDVLVAIPSRFIEDAISEAIQSCRAT